MLFNHGLVDQNILKGESYEKTDKRHIGFGGSGLHVAGLREKTR